MKIHITKIFYGIIVVLCCYGMYSCDDGDILLTEFEFETQELQLCNGAQAGDLVFFKINPELKEAISLNFNSLIFSETTVTTTPIDIELEGTSSAVIYRKFNTEITADYYCSTIPPHDIMVTEELMSSSGNARIITDIDMEDDNDGVDAIDESNGIDPRADPDNDGVPNYLDDDAENADILNNDGEIEAGFDTDNDGIPNFKDQDDDNDSILTSAEIANTTPDNDDLRDTDGDGIPDYLDADDDNDGVPTVEEDNDEDGDPRNDDEDGNGIPNYLQESTTIPSKAAEPLTNTIQTTYITRVTVTGLQFEGDNQNFQNSTFSFGAKTTTISR